MHGPHGTLSACLCSTKDVICVSSAKLSMTRLHIPRCMCTLNMHFVHDVAHVIDARYVLHDSCSLPVASLQASPETTVMLAGVSFQGREQEITLSDLVHVAEEQQHAWFQHRADCQVSQPCQLCHFLRQALHGSPTCVRPCIMACDASYDVHVCSFAEHGLPLAKRTECGIDERLACNKIARTQ